MLAVLGLRHRVEGWWQEMDKHVDDLFQSLTTIRAAAQLLIRQSDEEELAASGRRLNAIVDQTRRMETVLRTLRHETDTLVFHVAH